MTDNAEMRQEAKQQEPPPEPTEYYAMVVDSGPIIKHDVRNLMGKAQTYVTTPSVMREIRDSKARDHLDNSILPLLDLRLREPSDKAVQDVIAFAKQTGDYASLSTVDLHVLALTLDLEREGNLVNGNTDLDHIRTTPKRKIWLGSILPMNGKVGNTKTNNSSSVEAIQEEKKGDECNNVINAESEEKPKLLGPEDYDEVEESDGDEEDSDEDEKDEEEETETNNNEVVELTKEQSSFQSNTSEPRNSLISKVSSTTKESILNLKNKTTLLATNNKKLNEMQTKMASNAANMRESLASKISTTKDSLASKVSTTKEKVLTTTKDSLSKISNHKQKLDDSNSDVFGDCDDENQAEAKIEKFVMPATLNQMKQRMSENTNQMKQRVSENTANMRNSLASKVSATKQSMLNKQISKEANIALGSAFAIEDEEDLDLSTTPKVNDETIDETDDAISAEDHLSKSDNVAKDENGEVKGKEPAISPAPLPLKPIAKKSWATLVNPTTSSTMVAAQDAALALPFAKMSLKSTKTDDDNGGGQFDDASDDDDFEGDSANAATNTEEELQQEFPSLLAASTVPYQGEDDEAANEENSDESANRASEQNPHHKTRASVFMTEEERQQNLKPLSKAGRTYNSFRKYKTLMKPKQPKKNLEPEDDDEEAPMLLHCANDETATNTEPAQEQGSRFLTGGGGGEAMGEEDDDGQGWITSSDDIKFMKSEGGGRLDPGKQGTLGQSNNAANNSAKKKGPPISQRTACATTDFAMQNVLLQMNLILLSTEGMRIRRLKSWVIRCGACFKIHGADEDFQDETNHHMKRLFCSHCGSDMLQRISASVDGKTGRLKLHFSRRKQGRHHSIRGTKFALPKPGTGNKYKGDLLLREDQLLSGAWNQKVKINSGKKHQTAKSHSMFGRDIASSVGCNVKSTSSATFGGKGWANSSNTSSMNGFGSDDIRVGFGVRKNPNAAKGRERRGKKKKSTDRACGMRRY